ncbi:21127_t:CDS:2 [Dentiscutata erythropus]|uniref:21127_t:CDS:1 n=1 Tax=Dentiscutata erythropus TaxID=1348616 RepID=A0A9N9JRB9_9GLOM|nr:21127_t:CDS:2 [Dentiscutata erythropus]
MDINDSFRLLGSGISHFLGNNSQNQEKIKLLAYSGRSREISIMEETFCGSAQDATNSESSSRRDGAGSQTRKENLVQRLTSTLRDIRSSKEKKTAESSDSRFSALKAKIQMIRDFASSFNFSLKSVQQKINKAFKIFELCRGLSVTKMRDIPFLVSDITSLSIDVIRNIAETCSLYEKSNKEALRALSPSLQAGNAPQSCQESQHSSPPLTKKEIPSKVSSTPSYNIYEPDWEDDYPDFPDYPHSLNTSYSYSDLCSFKDFTPEALKDLPTYHQQNILAFFEYI